MEVTVDPSLLVNFVPLNALHRESQRTLARRSPVLRFDRGTQVPRARGNSDHLFLISGSVRIGGEDDQAAAAIGAGTADAARALPRDHELHCLTSIEMLTVDPGLLDVLLTWDQQNGALTLDSIESGTAASDDDWMIRLLQTHLFQQLPAANLQSVFLRMREMEVAAGQLIVRQGAPGDDFYMIKSGRCLITREVAGRPPIRLAEFESGACFGEESLLSNAPRNANVTMLTSGRLMRLAKHDFRELMVAPVLRELDWQTAKQQVESGRARWLDVRVTSESRHNTLENCLNLPLHLLRLRIEMLDPSMRYIAVCDTGRRSSVAAFILAQKGFDASLLRGGLNAAASPEPD